MEIKSGREARKTGPINKALEVWKQLRWIYKLNIQKKMVRIRNWNSSDIGKSAEAKTAPSGAPKTPSQTFRLSLNQRMTTSLMTHNNWTKANCWMLEKNFKTILMTLIRSSKKKISLKRPNQTPANLYSTSSMPALSILTNALIWTSWVVLKSIPA